MSFLKNYTSSVPISQTIARIESVLVRCGVKGITKEYLPGGGIAAVHFHLETPGGIVAIRIPAKVEECLQSLWLDYANGDTIAPDGKTVWSSYKKKTKKDFAQQAERTAWKIAQDWIEVQLSMIQLKQAEPLEVFMPYIWDGKQTYYQALRERGYAGLIAAKSEAQ